MVNVFVRDLDLGVVDRLDARRLEVVADGLPLFGGAQLATDTTLVSAIRQDGTPRRGAATRDGVALLEARRRKARTYPELTGQGGRARLVVLAGETGGRWSNETASFLLRWHMPNPGKHRQGCKKVLGQLGVAVVLLLGRSHCLCSICALLQGQMVMSPTCTMWSVTTVSAEFQYEGSVRT